jgi:hypothetical protein
MVPIDWADFNSARKPLEIRIITPVVRMYAWIFSGLKPDWGLSDRNGSAPVGCYISSLENHPRSRSNLSICRSRRTATHDLTADKIQ